jgi:hypothetical protein
MSPQRKKQMVEKNFELARKYFSFQLLRKELFNLISGFFGMYPQPGLLQRLLGRS